MKFINLSHSAWEILKHFFFTNFSLVSDLPLILILSVYTDVFPSKFGNVQMFSMQNLAKHRFISEMLEAVLYIFFIHTDSPHPSPPLHTHTNNRGFLCHFYRFCLARSHWQIWLSIISLFKVLVINSLPSCLPLPVVWTVPPATSVCPC